MVLELSSLYILSLRMVPEMQQSLKTLSSVGRETDGMNFCRVMVFERSAMGRKEAGRMHT